MDQFRIAVSKDGNLFAAAHFITYGEDAEAEPLHGHNYRVGAVLNGPLDAHHLVFDFVRLKRELEAIAARLDHRVLLAADNPHLRVEREDEAVTVRRGPDRYVFPARDVVVLDVPNTTAEMIAAWIADRLVERLGEDAASLTTVEIEVEETTGQTAVIRRELPG
jgi:6-pyruvoyltetrahydropterin/6-carboxytetrahydropterin synthase